MPTIGLEPGTRRLAIAYYTLRPDGADAELVTSADGTRWGASQRLSSRRMAFDWMPQTTLGRMLADYIGVDVVPRASARDLRARIAAAERKAAPGDLRRPRIRAPTLAWASPRERSEPPSGISLFSGCSGFARIPAY